MSQPAKKAVRPAVSERIVCSWLAPIVFTVGIALASGSAPSSASEALASKAERTLRSAAEFFREHVAVHGSYVWKVSADMSYRRGEAKTTPNQGWAQSPGTPAVGTAYVGAYEATGDRYYLDGARDAAHALAATQLVSGGWTDVMEFDIEARNTWCYRRLEATCSKHGARKNNKGRDASSLDDDITQGAVRLLLVVDALGQHGDSAIGDATSYALEKLLEAQYPNGAWPVRLDQRVPDDAVVAETGTKARLPKSWSRSFTDVPGPEFFVLNDHLVATMIRTMLLAHHQRGDGRFLQAAVRAGNFLLAAQMPEKQRGWAHVYSSAMEPIWGRKFEPPALASWETASTIAILLDLYRYTGFERYLSAIKPAARWLEDSQIGEEIWARFYELETGKPLYMTREYELTYRDDDLPTHYGFQGRFGIPEVLAEYRAVRDRGPTMSIGPADLRKPDAQLIAKVEEVIAALDDQGRWLDDDMIRSASFIENVEILSRFIASARGRPLPIARM